jgi:hypothetical protein
MEENQVTENVALPVEDTEREKMLSQSQVNKIVQHEKTKAAAAAKREAEEKYQRELETIKSNQTQRNENVPRDVDANALYQQVQERFNQEMQQKQIESEMNRVANSYLSKMQEGRKAYEDFDEITKEFDPSAFPQLTYLVAGIDNAADIIYELASNPTKLTVLDRLAEKNPKQAQAELLKLSRSIMENRQAQSEANSQNVAAPLDRLQSSRVSGSNGKLSIRDLRSQPWLRG